MQRWFDLSDPRAEDSLYTSESMRRFARIELGQDVVPDETTILRFRHLLEQHHLNGAMDTMTRRSSRAARAGPGTQGSSAQGAVQGRVMVTIMTGELARPRGPAVSCPYAAGLGDPLGPVASQRAPRPGREQRAAHLVEIGQAERDAARARFLASPR